ncbi:hypothetical protein P8452_71574 [Trifolium repens]|nr:hypothetical protein P8452_71574 [Trifolium repens]
MDDGEWDLMSIVRSCKATTVTNPNNIFEMSPPQTPITITTTNNIIPTQNTTPSYFSDLTVIQNNNQVPVAPLKPTDFIDLEKLRINFNNNNTLPIHTTILPNPTTSSPISTTTTPITSATTIPTYITTTPFDCEYNHPSVSQQPPRQHNQLPILLPPQTPITITTNNNIIPPHNTTLSYLNDFIAIRENIIPIPPFEPINFIDLDKFRFNFNHNNTLQIPATFIPNSTTITTPTIITNPTTSIPTVVPTYTTTAHVDCTYNHPSVPQQPLRLDNELPQNLITITTNNNIIPPQNTTPSYWNDFTVIQNNNLDHIPSFKPTNFIDLEKFRFNFNHNNTLQIPTTIIPNSTTIMTPTIITTSTTSIPTIIPTTTTTTFSPISTTTNPTSSTTTVLTQIPTAHFDCAYNHPSVPQQPSGQHNQLPNLQPRTSSTTIIPTTTTFSPISTTTIPTSPTTTIVTQIPTAHFDRAYNHPSVPQQPSGQHNQLASLQPQTSSRVLPNTYPGQPKYRSRKRKNYNQVTLVCQVKKENLSEDQWVWRKYGQKSIKGSPHPRSYYKCTTSKDCSARKLVEKSKTIENTYVLTYIGVHNHEKPLVTRNSRRWSYLSSQSSQMRE